MIIYFVFSLKNIRLQQENSELLQKLQSIQDQKDFVQQAIRDRDEAIAKYITHLFWTT